MNAWAHLLRRVYNNSVKSLVSSPSKASCHFLFGQTCPAGPTCKIYSLSMSHLKTPSSFLLHSFSTTPSSSPCHTVTPFVRVTRLWVVSKVIHLSVNTNLSTSQRIHWSGGDRVLHSWGSQQGVRGPLVVHCAIARGPWNNKIYILRKILWPLKTYIIPQIVTGNFIYLNCKR